MEGWVYVLELHATEFRARGLDAAYRISVRLNDVVRDALTDDPEVLEILTGPHHRASGSRKNFMNEGVDFPR